MKTLYIIRHAKSSWSFDLRDFDRPLGDRGRRDVKKIGKYLQDNLDPPKLMITSPASRAFYTALFIADAWGYPEYKIVLDPAFYHGSPNGIIKTLSALGNISSVAIFGHNPGLTDLANTISDANIDNISTCGVIGIEYKMDSWKSLDKVRGQQFVSITPKSLP